MLRRTGGLYDNARRQREPVAVVVAQSANFICFVILSEVVVRNADDHAVEGPRVLDTGKDNSRSSSGGPKRHGENAFTG
jgi:hypothetical protein